TPHFRDLRPGSDRLIPEYHRMVAGLESAVVQPHPPLNEPAERFLNRELSWLDFNARVLALAEDRQLPLLERAKFLAIFSQNLDELFIDSIFPVLTPLAVDPAHPFPYISNLSLNLAVTVRDPSTGEERFARVKVPPLLPRFVALADGVRFVLLEQVIAAKLDSLFPGMEVLAHHPFRVTRDADFELEDEAEDLLEAMEKVQRRCSNIGRVVRLEVDTKTTGQVPDL